MTSLTRPETLERARRLLEAGRGAAWPELLRLIETLSLNICEVTIPELAELIEKDAVILSRVIAVANTLAHNPAIAPIATLSQAIHRIGYNRIRTVALSLMLLESAGAAQAGAQREAASLALCSGLMAQGMATELGTHDPEFVFACAALRNFGRIVMASLAPELVQEAAKRARHASEAEAFRSLFGLTPLELSRELLAAARLPAEVIDALRECEPASFAPGAANHAARLVGMADYGSRLAALALESHKDPEDFVRKSAALGEQFERLLPGTTELAANVLRHADERLGSFSRSNGARTMPTASLQRVRFRATQLASIAATESDAAANDAPCEAAAAAWDLPAIAAPEALVETTSPEKPPLAFACEATEASHCWLYRIGGDRAGFAVSTGVGPGWEAARRAGAIAPGERSIFGVATVRHEVVVVHDTHAPSIARYLPAWWREVPQAPRSFLLIPVAIGGKIEAIVLTGWAEPRRIPLAREKVERVRQHIATLVSAPNPITAAAA